MNTKKIFLLSLLLAGSMQVAQCHDAVPNANDFLIEAVRNADVKKVKTLLRTYVDVNTSDEQGNTPLFYAVGQDNLEMVNLLIEADADVNYRNDAGKTPIFCAESVEIAQALIDAGADVSVITYTGETVLFGCRKSSLLNLFIQKCIAVNAQNNSGDTALHNAVWNLDMTKIDTLIASGASIWIKNTNDETVVDIAHRYSSALVLHLINSDTTKNTRYYGGLFFDSMIKQLITDVKGRYLSKNSACGYRYSEYDHKRIIKIVDAMIKKDQNFFWNINCIMSLEIADLDELTKGSQAEQDLCAEFQVVPKTLSVYNYKKAMKVELDALKNELEAKCDSKGILDSVADFIVEHPGLYLGVCLAGVYLTENYQGNHDVPLNQFVDSTFDLIKSAITEFAATIDFPSFVSI